MPPPNHRPIALMRFFGYWTGLAGILLLAGGMAGLIVAGQVGEFGEIPASLGPASPVETRESTDSRRPDPEHSTGTPLSSEQSPDDQHDPPDDQRRPHAAAGVTARPARLADLGSAPEPTSVTIESLGISAPVDPVGTDSEGSTEIPEDVWRAGWFRHGPSPGSETGSSVITAHVDSDQQGAGVFFRLRDVQQHDRVTVTDTENETIEYEVVALAHYRKTELPMAKLFRSDGPHRLVLITCGGVWDADTRSYADNVVVIAEPLP